MNKHTLISYLDAEPPRWGPACGGGGGRRNPQKNGPLTTDFRVWRAASITQTLNVRSERAPLLTVSLRPRLPVWGYGGQPPLFIAAKT